MFPVNAMATGTERQVYTSELQQCLIKIVKKSIKPMKVPLKWFVYELDLEKESNNTHGVLKKSKCVDLGTDLGMTLGEIEECLFFFNKLALLVYNPDFPDTVLIKMDPFVERLSALIRISFKRPQFKTSDPYNKLKQCGLFKKSLLLTAFESVLDDGAISVDAFLHISECLKVIVHVINDEYFIPSVLSVDCNQDCIKDQLIPCVLNWGDHIVLPCFFFTLIVMLLRQKDNFTLPYNTKQNISQARNRIILNVEQYGGFLTLTNEIKWIGVYYSGDSIEYYVEILKMVREALREVVKYLKNCMGTQYPFLSFVCRPECTYALECHPCKLTIDFKNCICSSDQSNVYPVTDDMKKIIKSVVPLFNNDTGSSLPSITPILPCPITTTNTTTDTLIESAQETVDDTILYPEGLVIVSVMRYTQNITDWSVLSLLLGLTPSDMYHINTDSVDYNSKHLAIVTKWLEEGSASWAALVNGLKDPLVNRIDIANQIAKDHPKLRSVTITEQGQPSMPQNYRSCITL